MKNAYRITRDGRVVCEVAGRVSSAAVKRIARAIEKNPTLVHHGLAKGAAYHLTSTLSGPVADLYVPVPMLARSVAQLVSNALNETVEVTKNTLVGKGSVHSRAGTRRPGGRGRLGIPSRNPAGDPRVGETWTEFTSGAKFRVVSVGASDITALNLETGNRVRIGRTEFAATMRAPRTRTNPVDDDPRQFSVGDEVSISAMPYFGRHGVVVAVGTKLVSVRVNLIDRVVKFRAGDLRLVNPSRSKSAQTKRKMFRRTYRGSRSRKAAKGAQLKKFAWLADQRSERIARRALRGNPEPRIVYNKLLGGWYVVTGPHQTPLNGRFNSKAEAQVWLDGRRTRNPKGRLPGNVEIVEALGGGWMVLVNGFQWGRGEPDPSGAYDDVFPTKAAATAAYLEAHPKRNPKGRELSRGARLLQDVAKAHGIPVGWNELVPTPPHAYAFDLKRMFPGITDAQALRASKALVELAEGYAAHGETLTGDALKQAMHTAGLEAMKKAARNPKGRNRWPKPQAVELLRDVAGFGRAGEVKYAYREQAGDLFANDLRGNRIALEAGVDVLVVRGLILKHVQSRGYRGRHGGGLYRNPRDARTRRYPEVGTPALGTLTVRGTRYTVHAMSSKYTPWFLVGPRGAQFGLIRHRDKPWLFYAINAGNPLAKAGKLEGLTFTGETFDQLGEFTGKSLPRPNPTRYVVRAARGYVYGLRGGRPGEWSYDWTTHHRNASPMTKGMAESLAKAVGGEAIRVTLDRDGRPQGPIPNPTGRKQSHSRRRGGRARRTRNPSSELERAKRTALMWNEFPATGSRRVKVRSLRIPKHLVKLGDLDSVVYRSKKYGGKPKLYEHRFKRPLPVLTSDPDGRSMHIVGGGYTITGDGLVN